jgi:O-acetyl-ADP-ribose deacetylase (regulator of RNase III)
MRIEARLADITTLDVDAIVNAANSQLAAGGGVCGAIHRAAGPKLAEACEAVAPCPTGQARLTPGFRLKARYVIHAVGPVWHGGARHEPDLLASAYRSSLALARERKVKSIAFPAISTGIYGYPLEKATHIAVEAVRGFSKPGSLSHVIFACFDEQALRAYADQGVPIEPEATP